MSARKFDDGAHAHVRDRGVRLLVRVNCQVGETTRHTPVYSVTQLTASAGQYQTFEASEKKLRAADNTPAPKAE